ncbi:ThuA domain-containing protein [Salegentibacter chungangensis]|uniref:ThuA domain-containing protein n=1 Tax=Salegentibacter chungangensis TaxID=1335724 RepID=A0ABW3NMI6_9FLAO
MNLINKLPILGIFLFSYVIGFAQEPEVLVFSKTKGFWHKSIPAGIEAIEEMGEEYGFKVSETDEAKEFSPENLKKYKLVIFLNTTGNVLNNKQQQAFEEYIEGGGNFFGIHSAADTEYDWPWYGNLVGAYFNGHPPVAEAEIIVEKPDHLTVSHLSGVWTRRDEWYNYKNISPHLEMLLRLDESTYEGGENGENHPIAWYQELPGGGKAIYTGGGHTIESYIEPRFREHLLRCIQFATAEHID